MPAGHWHAGLLALACFLAAAQAQTEVPPDASLFAPVQIAGDLSTGFPAYYYGCADNGATLQDIIVYSNNNFLRGIEVHALQPDATPLQGTATSLSHASLPYGLLVARGNHDLHVICKSGGWMSATGCKGPDSSARAET